MCVYIATSSMQLGALCCERIINNIIIDLLGARTIKRHPHAAHYVYEHKRAHCSNASLFTGGDILLPPRSPRSRVLL